MALGGLAQFLSKLPRVGAALDSTCCPARRAFILTFSVTQHMWSLGKHLSPSLGPVAWAAACILGLAVIWIIHVPPVTAAGVGGSDPPPRAFPSSPAYVRVPEEKEGLVYTKVLMTKGHRPGPLPQRALCPISPASPLRSCVTWTEQVT